MQLPTDRVNGFLTIPFFLCKGKIFLRPFFVPEHTDAERIIPVGDGYIIGARGHRIRLDDRHAFFILYFGFRIVPQPDICRTDIRVDNRIIGIQFFGNPIILQRFIRQIEPPVCSPESEQHGVIFRIELHRFGQRQEFIAVVLFIRICLCFRHKDRNISIPRLFLFSGLLSFREKLRSTVLAPILSRAYFFYVAASAV